MDDRSKFRVARVVGTAMVLLALPTALQAAQARMTSNPAQLAGDAMEQRAVDALVRRFDPAIRVYSANFTHIALDSSRVVKSKQRCPL